ncbi:2TM domain-containing protein [Flagellimonas sediminis]|uniref:2TM domain-containing protein n=1 Tax=Flagellimonas sediminis TaxID=2696468 RepID=A0A6I5L109_9FLAO|nr:2TM domain-containing protein [Allomuricauda sediminis]NDV43878.1 hypothetical protein [Allomuricauda sediminis]
MENLENDKYTRAKKRVEELKGFYVHLSIYVVINTFVLVNIYVQTDNFWQWPHFLTLFGWGLGLAFHAAKVFGANPLLGKDWEERQIQKYIDKDKEDINKYL